MMVCCCAMSLRIAVDITHPAHFHVFKHALAEWNAKGYDVLILARDKDLTLTLLAEAQLPFHQLSKARQGLSGLAIEWIEHASRALPLLRRHRSQVAVSVGGIFITHAARLLRIPSLVFYDTEHARISNRVTYPFATRIFTPRAYQDDLGKRHIRYLGYQELAYLHPNRFTPDPTKLALEGLTPEEPFTFIRLVAWTSHHDVSDSGITDLRAVVASLEHFGRVLISAEAPLPDDLKHYERRGTVGDVHHVLAFARLFFGESATMASEAAQLGVPGIFLSTSSRGYTDELEARYGMVHNFNGIQANQEAALEQAQHVLAQPKAVYAERHANMMAEQVDVTHYIMQQVETFARR